MANHGSDLPELPDGFEVVWVDFDSTDTSQYSNIQVDKGLRILSGILHSGSIGHIMFVDDDDLVNRHLVSFVNAHPRANGWYFHQGYLWSKGLTIPLSGTWFSRTVRNFPYHQIRTPESTQRSRISIRELSHAIFGTPHPLQTRFGNRGNPFGSASFHWSRLSGGSSRINDQDRIRFSKIFL